MTRDILIGCVLSLAVHGGVFLASDLFAKPPPASKPAQTDSPREEFKVPPPPLDEIELIPDTDPSEKSKYIDRVAPPQQDDLLTRVSVDDLTQKYQPPPSPDVKIDGKSIVIPHSTGSDGSGTRGVRVYDLTHLDTEPAARFQAQPVYPFEMRRAGITGTVVVGFIVDASGAVRDVQVLRSTQREFESAALQAVAKWTFRPGRKDGRAVNTRMQVPIVFSITGE